MSLQRIFVVGNEKGGVGKTTCSMHLICYLLYNGLKVASIDLDNRQLSLTRYLEKRQAYNTNNPDKKVPVTSHFVVSDSSHSTLEAKHQQEVVDFRAALDKALSTCDVVVIDTPGSASNLSKFAHSVATTIITPINDSFLDLDVMATIDAQTLKMIAPSIYSEMIWQQRIVNAKEGRKSIEWIVVRNRVSSTDSTNKKNVGAVLNELSKKLNFKVAPGFTERVIFRELFLHGITLLDLTKARYEKSISPSHVAARQEMRDFVKFLKI